MAKIVLGQHFMTDEKVLAKVADAAALEKTDRVLEIGAGEGALTQLLAERCGVTAVEKDSGLYGRVVQKFPNNEFPKVRIIHGDALKIKWPSFGKCVSNLPYSISKPFILKLLQHDFRLAVLVLQEEFAQKLAAKSGEKAYGPVSICAQLCCSVELLDKVPRNAFSPQPKVGSRIVRLAKRRDLDKGFLEFVVKLFQNRNRIVSGAGGKRARDLSPDELLSVYAGDSDPKIIGIKTADVRDIAMRIKSGAVFVYPTDTVYGIGCDATDRKAVERIFDIKGRDGGKPMSVAFSDVAQMAGYVSAGVKELAEMRKKLPGPYTFIVGRGRIPAPVTAGLNTVGVRVPDCAPLLRLIKAAGVPIVTTSANLSGQPPACSIDEVPESVLKKVDFTLDGGCCGSGRPSTVIDLATGKRLR